MTKESWTSPVRHLPDPLKERIADLERQLRLEQGSVDLEKAEVAHLKRQLEKTQNAREKVNLVRENILLKRRAANAEAHVAWLRDAMDHARSELNVAVNMESLNNAANAHDVLGKALAGDGGQKVLMSAPHINAAGEFQSDKYPWCHAGFVPLKLTDPMARPVLWEYARQRESVDKEFSDDLRTCLWKEGYDGGQEEK